MDPKLAQAEDLLKQRILFTPLRSKEALHNWIKVFLDIDLPDAIVADEGPNPSNCSPMDMVWKIYEACLNNNTGNMSRVMAYASRDSFKTLAASILEVLAVLHLDRDVGHMAAIESQALNAQAYVKMFFEKPYLRDFKAGDAKEKTEIVRYYNHMTGISLSEKEWALQPEEERAQYERIYHYIKIVICTMRGANSLHVPFLVVDEVDVVQDPNAYKQARFIPSVYKGKEPITLLTSTRKTGTGLVQDELDKAEKSGLIVWHWNIIDVTEKCPTERHRPDLPKLPIYRSDDTLLALSEEKWKSLPDDEQAKYTRDEDCHNGCLTNCKIYAVCRGKLAVNAKKTAAETNTLRTITNTQNRFIENSADEELVKAELLCWRPSTENLVYPRLNPQIHKLTPAQIAEKILGEAVNPTYTKQQLYALAIQREMQFYVGIDWGYSHNFVIVIGLRDGVRMFILDCWSMGEKDDAQKIDFCTRRFKHLDPIVFADPESPSTIAQFKRAGFRMRDWQKGKGSVVGGIQVVRMKLWPVMGREPQLFFVKGDKGVDFLFEKLSKWHWLTDKAGRLTDEPTDDGKDEPDALRYMVMNVFAPKGRIIVPKEDERMTAPMPEEPQYTTENWARKVIAEATGMGFETDEAIDDSVPLRGKRGNLLWDMG